MMKIKNLLAVAALALGFTTSAVAQEWAKDYKPYPHMFIGVQGGVQTTHTTTYDNSKLITPTASLSLGAFFTPVVGARLHFNGLWNKGGLEVASPTAAQNFEYEYKYLTSDLDLMINLCTLFGKKKYYPVNVYLIGGIGLNTAWDNGQAFSKKDDGLALAYDDTRFTHNARIGAQLDWNLCRNLSLNLEVDANSLGDRYNSKYTDCDDWQMTAQLGLTFKFGHKKTKAPEEVWETRIDTIWYDDVTTQPRIDEGIMTWNVFYSIRESDFTAEQELAKIGAFLADHRECKISIKSYADKETGNPTLNAEYARLRSEKAKEALVKAGVAESIIKAESFGDTVQPFAENDKNRVSIITATGLRDLKEKYIVKKFRTKEVRYRVK